MRWLYWLLRRWDDMRDRPSDVSERWLAEQERSERSQGVEQLGVIRWPMNKVVNEHPVFNTIRLRKQA